MKDNKMVMPHGEQAMRAEFERILPLMEAGGFIPSVNHQTPPGVSLENDRIYLRLPHFLIAARRLRILLMIRGVPADHQHRHGGQSHHVLLGCFQGLSVVRRIDVDGLKIDPVGGDEPSGHSRRHGEREAACCL